MPGFTGASVACCRQDAAILNLKSFSIQFSALQIFNGYTMFHNALNAWDIMTSEFRIAGQDALPIVSTS
jgi:hypothetical protein